MTKNPYDILGVPKDASDEVIKKAYRKLAKQFHPDRNQEDNDAEARYKDVVNAYEILSDSQKKQNYDRYGTEKPQHQGFGGSRSDIDDWASFFYYQGFGGEHKGRKSFPRNVQVDVLISLEDVFAGCKKSISFARPVACKECQASGGSFKQCANCNGKGVIELPDGPFRVRSNCQTCKGQGQVINKACKHCQGNKHTAQHESITITIPRGVYNGSKLRVRGRGEILIGGECGDLLCSIYVKNHDRFERDGLNLIYKVNIGIPDAVLGTTINVKTISNKDVDINIPAGTQYGQILRVKRQGLRDANTNGVGDLFVIIEIEIPRTVSEDERKLFEELKTHSSTEELESVSS